MASLRVIFWAACIVQAACVSSSSSHFHPHAASDRNYGPDEQARSTCSDERCELLLAVATSIRKLSSFVAANAALANDDLFFTLRLAQGQLYQLRRDAPHLYAAGEVADLLTAADEDLASAALVLEKNFKLNGYLGDEFSFIMDPARGRTMERIDATVTIPEFWPQWLLAFLQNLGKTDDFSKLEDQSDQCLGQLSPQNLTSEEAALVGRSSYCPVDDPCWLMMTKPGTTGYYLTHQVLFFALGGTTGCGPDFETYARRYYGNSLPLNIGPITPEILRYQCRIVLLEASLTMANGIQDNQKDLFLEQGFLCGESVYIPEFFNPSWIRTILSWQKPSGCFGFTHSIGSDVLNQKRDGRSMKTVEKHYLPHDSRDSVDDLDDMKVAKNVGPNPRRETSMTGNCFSHNTGVALGYLSVAIKYLTD